jgi:tripartite-type tricarboxylate transporter receptor subunit TctC
MVHVPYKGAAPAMVDLLAGNVHLLFSAPTPTQPHVLAGKLRGVGLLGRKRHEALPDVPTAAESGYPELTDVVEWYGVVAPAATPREIIATMNAGMVQALKSPDVIARLASLGQTVAPSTPEEFSAYIRRDYERWGKVVKTSGAKVD